MARFAISAFVAMMLISAPSVGWTDGVRIGVRTGSLASWPVVVAGSKGLFAAERVEPELIIKDEDGALAEALATGEVEMAILPTPLFFALHMGSGPFEGRPKRLKTFQVMLTQGSALVTSAKSGIRYSRQIAGKDIGVTSMYETSQLLMALYVEQSGLVPGEDTGWREVGWKDGRDGFVKGEIEVLAVEEWLAYKLVDEQGGHLMAPMQKLWVDYPAYLMAVTEEFWMRDEDSVRGIGAALVKGALVASKGDAKFFGSLEVEGLKPPQPILDGRGTAGFNPFPYLSGMRVLVEEMRKKGRTPLNTDARKVVEETCMPSLARELMTGAGFENIPAEDSRDERMIGCCYTFF